MGNISPSSMAAAVGAGVKNVVHKSSATVMPRKLLIIATQSQAYLDCAPLGKPFLVTSPEDVTGRSGFGTMAHRLALAAFRGSKNSVPVYLMLLEETPSSQSATGQIAVTAEASHAGGELALYVGGKAYKITVTPDDTAAAIGEKIADALERDLACPVVASNAGGNVTLTSKSKGPWGNGITVAVNQRLREDEALPDGVTCAITAMSGGSGLPDLEAALLNGLGRGDSANEDEFTGEVDGYGKDTQILNAKSQYVGEGNEFSGLYSRTIARPFRSMTGDTSTGSAGLQALTDFTANRKNDRCNGICAKPGSLTHPAEIAAELMGAMEAVSGGAAEGSYIGLLLSGVDPGVVARDSGQDWTTEYTNCDLAVKSGISHLIVANGSVTVQNVMSFYRPDSIPPESNAYAKMRNIAVIQNILYNLKKNFKSEKWQGCTVVKDKSLVTVAVNRYKARDVDDVKDDLLALINSFMSMAWLYDTEFSIKKLKEPDAVQPRLDGSGFNNSLYLILSGELGITDTVAYLDTSIAITLN